MYIKGLLTYYVKMTLCLVIHVVLNFPSFI